MCVAHFFLKESQPLLALRAPGNLSKFARSAQKPRRKTLRRASPATLGSSQRKAQARVLTSRINNRSPTRKQGFRLHVRERLLYCGLTFSKEVRPSLAPRAHWKVSLFAHCSLFPGQGATLACAAGSLQSPKVCAQRAKVAKKDSKGYQPRVAGSARPGY